MPERVKESVEYTIFDTGMQKLALNKSCVDDRKSVSYGGRERTAFTGMLSDILPGVLWVVALNSGIWHRCEKRRFFTILDS